MTVIVGFWIPEVSSPSLSPSLSLSLSLPSSIHAHAPFFPARVPRWLPACALGGGPAPPPHNPAPLCAHARRWPRGPTPPDGRALPAVTPTPDVSRPRQLVTPGGRALPRGPAPSPAPPPGGAPTPFPGAPRPLAAPHASLAGPVRLSVALLLPEGSAHP
eukprot:XP_020404537.1 proline-rich protein 2-like [Zea mays]